MSKEIALKFIQQLSEDAKLQETLRTATLDAIVEVANNAGFDFTSADYSEAMQLFQEAQNAELDELPEDVLDLVAGGTLGGNSNTLGGNANTLGGNTNTLGGNSN